MKKDIFIIFIGLAFSNNITLANEYQVEIKEEQKALPVSYQSPSIGVEIIFASDGSKWDKIMANGESELLIGDRREVRQATAKAVLRAKASISKFLKEKLTTSETIEEITKTLSNAKVAGEKSATSVDRKTIETLTSKISNSSDAILKGVIILEQHVNQKEKYVSVKLGMSRKTMKTADKMSNLVNKDLSQPDIHKNREKVVQQSNNNNEIRRSSNYENF